MHIRQAAKVMPYEDTMSNFSLSLVLGLVAALADVFGALILVRTSWEKRYLRYFVALGAGFMLAAALLEMIPESFRLSFRWTPVLVLAGYCLIHLLEHTITPHFHFRRRERVTTNCFRSTPAIPWSPGWRLIRSLMA